MPTLTWSLLVFRETLSHGMRKALDCYNEL